MLACEVVGDVTGVGSICPETGVKKF